MKWKLGQPVEIYKAPRCQAELSRQRIYAPYKGFDDYILAEIIADRWSERTLIQAGTVNFWTMTGPELIRALEKILTFGIGVAAESAIARRYAAK